MSYISKLKSKIELEENLYQWTYCYYHSGSCQCSKNCDCYNKQGEYSHEIVKYSNGIVLNPDGKEKHYSSIEGCKASLKANLNKIVKP